MNESFHATTGNGRAVSSLLKNPPGEGTGPTGPRILAANFYRPRALTRHPGIFQQAVRHLKNEPPCQTNLKPRSPLRVLQTWVATALPIGATPRV